MSSRNWVFVAMLAASYVTGRALWLVPSKRRRAAAPKSKLRTAEASYSETPAPRESVRVRYSRDEDGYWTAVAEFGGLGNTAISDGATLEQARARIREAIAVRRDLPKDSFEIVDDVVDGSRR